MNKKNEHQEKEEAVDIGIETTKRTVLYCS